MEKQKPILTTVYAIHDFQAENPDELSFSAGEPIQVTEKDDQYGDGWWQGHNTKGQFGLFPQAYTIPAGAIATNPQLTMNETLNEVQTAIDQLHHPSPSTISLAQHSKDSTQSTGFSIDQSDDTDHQSTHNNNSNPAQARALLAQKAQADSYSSVIDRLKSAALNQNHLTHRSSLSSLVSVPGIGDIELSEESGSEDDHRHFPRSRSSTLAGPPDKQPNNNNNNNTPISPSFSSAPKLNSQPSSSDSSRQTAFKPGPFSAAALALGLTKENSNEKEKAFKKTHQTQKPSSSSILSDMGIDLRELNLSSAPVASTLRMSRESSQFTNLPTISDPNNRRVPNSAPSDGIRSVVPNVQSSGLTPGAIAQIEPPSPQEHLSESVVAVDSRSSSSRRKPMTSRSQENLKATSSKNLHQRQASACSTGSSIFLHQQLSQLANNPINQDTKTSVSTADSSSAKGSRSRSSSRIEQFVSIENQPTSPATSTFPPSTGGARQGDGSLSSSQSKSHKPFGFGAFPTGFPDQWTVTEVAEWAKVKGLDEFTVGKFIEHEITGDVLLELDVNALKEIDLTAFGRRVRVIKAIEELKKNIASHKQSLPSPLSPLSDEIHMGSTSIDSSIQPSPLSNPRMELANQHGLVRLSSSSKQDYSTFPYQKPYHPSADVSDREEELAQQSSSRDSVSKTSSFQQRHGKRPSDASVLSSHNRRQENNENSQDFPEERVPPSSEKILPGFQRTTSTGRPRQSTFSNHDTPQSDHQRSQSKAAVEINRRSRASSWTPVTEFPELNSDLTDTPITTLEEPIVLDTPELNVDEKPKKGKRKKLGIQKAPGTANSVLKNNNNNKQKISIESPDRRPPSPDTPDKSNDNSNPIITTTAHPAKSRSSFLGNLRVRKPPPKLNSQSPVNTSSTSNNNNSSNDNELRPNSSSGIPNSINGKHGRSLFHFGSSGSSNHHEKVQGQSQHQIQHLSPSHLETKNSISSPLSTIDDENPPIEFNGGGASKKESGTETRTALERIGNPDHLGWMRKKGEKYPTWKLRYFILKGPNLYYLKSQNEIRIKGLIKLAGFKVVMDSDVHPGRYGFRIIHDNGTSHLFSADDSKLLRDWMKAMMKATIDRDWIAPVISSCNIRTIPIREAQKMFPPPRPPSPLSRARVQKARLAAHPEILSNKDAAVLMGFQNLQLSQSQLSTSESSEVIASQLRPRKSVHRETRESKPQEENLSSEDRELLGWINSKINHDHQSNLMATDFSDSIRNGLVLVRLIESLTGTSSGLNDQDFLGSSTHNKKNAMNEFNGGRQSIIEKDEDFDIYFEIFDYLNSMQVPLVGYSLNDLISGDSVKTRDFLIRVYNRFES
ncbi:hypothetical protein MJO28_001017 [Puccinia striiformis f. sp. tritici]|uniref:Uncharacterized protein n=1 Tax=Puccinia striiformis f. sp. tritici TaxID=168172 RepID=A0ACC0EZ19_9BASI|nr:hypothetical protein Pst134EA_000233 [Puccinia striiformis f. sp. tritici]KAH9473155.1 hypothetical protein Pst134EA_000233 [Puccinia striiformis f. sp. tritici]KAI7962923.1 hypothetical protein MJO28_001017 [Puccinia striiformis f. sp. tritici]KAI9599982.1 hypothetical protein KEM48_000096 [Puccinia striiformis f. sp. tritici PST-130]